MKILGEMKRRNLFRVGIAYIVAAWLLVQVGDIARESFEAPAWVMKMFITSIIAGFPIVMFFSWAYEITPQGIKKESEVDRSQSITHETGKKLDYVTMAMLIAVISLVALERYLPERLVSPRQQAQAEQAAEPGVPAETREPEPVIVENSIAVLPFVNMSADPEQEYFSDGMSEELLNLLARVDGLKVASRTSTFGYKGANKNIPQIARELRVANIVEGSVRKAGNRLRITAQLIDTSNDRHLWSESYDRDLTDIFAIQEEIANAIVSALKTELGLALNQASLSVTAATGNMNAYDFYLQARELFLARKNLETSIQLFEKAIELDPDFARAWEGLAATHSVAGSWIPADRDYHYERSAVTARKALEIDPGLSMPYAVIAFVPATLQQGFSAVLENLDQAIENDPKNATAWLWRGIWLKDIGYFERAASNLEQCLEIDADYLNCKQHLAETYLSWGKTEQVIRLFEETIEANFHSVSDAFVSHYVHSGDRIKALLLAAAAMRAEYAPIKDWIEAIENPGDNQGERAQRFMQWIEEADKRCANLGGVITALGLFECLDPNIDSRAIWHPDAAGFRKTDAFKEYVSRKHMDFWLAHGFPPQCRQLSEEDFECD